MRLTILILTLAIASCNCTGPGKSTDDNNGTETLGDSIHKKAAGSATKAFIPENLFTLSDAEKILGEPAHLNDSTSKAPGRASGFRDSMSPYKKDAFIYHCSFQANSKDIKTGKTGIVYFVIEKYPDTATAKMVYSYYEKANMGAIGYKVLDEPGDEAWFGSSPLLIQLRKDRCIFVLKVNKMTVNTSEDDFKTVAKKIADSL
jgi:hypothetical protein